jgi:hypothetical protein
VRHERETPTKAHFPCNALAHAGNGQRRLMRVRINEAESHVRAFISFPSWSVLLPTDRGETPLGARARRSDHLLSQMRPPQYPVGRSGGGITRENKGTTCVLLQRFPSRGLTPYVSTLRDDGPRGSSKRARTHASWPDDAQQFNTAKSLFGKALLIDRAVNSCLNILNLPV